MMPSPSIQPDWDTPSQIAMGFDASVMAMPLDSENKPFAPRALNNIVERWTLLLVRELLIGPRRYGELADNLPGMGTNLLAARLKEMAAQGLLGREGGLYSLTDLGRELEPVVHAMVRFGLALNVSAGKDYLHRDEWDTVALKALYRPEQDPGLQGRYQIDIDGVPFCLEKSGPAVAVTLGACEQPVAGISLEKSTRKAHLTGDPDEAGRLAQALGIGETLA